MADAAYLPFDASPTLPAFSLPEGAVDSHCHVFGPSEVFPFASERKYTPCDAPKEALFSLRDFLGFERNVIVQATCHGKDNSALVDALTASGERARGIAIVDPGVDESELERLQKAGVRGVRFNFVRRLANAVPPEHHLAIVEKVAGRGWHVVVYFESRDLNRVAPLLSQIRLPIVIDHLGRPDIAAGVEGSDFSRLVEMLDQNDAIWIKVSGAERLSLLGPPYDDVIPFARTLVERFPDRVLWGTDWPHPNMKSHVPDDGVLVDTIPKIATTAALQRALLVDNPKRLYWPNL